MEISEKIDYHRFSHIYAPLLVPKSTIDINDAFKSSFWAISEQIDTHICHGNEKILRKPTPELVRNDIGLRQDKSCTSRRGLPIIRVRLDWHLNSALCSRDCITPAWSAYLVVHDTRCTSGIRIYRGYTEPRKMSRTYLVLVRYEFRDFGDPLKNTIRTLR